MILNELGRKNEARDIFKLLIDARAKGLRMNEDNEVYANYPRQIGIGEVAALQKALFE